MLVVADIAPLHLRRLEHALRGAHDIVVIPCGCTIKRAQASEADVLVVDPLRLRLESEETQEWVVSMYARKVLLYTTLSSHAMRATCRALRANALHLIIAEYEDGPELLRRTVERIAGSRDARRGES